jgi:HlyD family secretion protein
VLAATGQATPAPQPVRARIGISDGVNTEVADGLKEGDLVVTAVKLTPAQTAAAPAGASPFGGGGGGGGGFRGGGR